MNSGGADNEETSVSMLEKSFKLGGAIADKQNKWVKYENIVAKGNAVSSQLVE